MVSTAGVRIVHESPDELVVVKPAGMASELTDDPQGRSLLAGLRARFGSEIRLCHRLDRPTLGFVVAARSREMAAWHAERLQRREWRKYYLARVARPDPGLVGTHRLYLRERAHRVEVVRAGGQPAWLEVLAVEGPHILVQLLTGRRHQVRVMLAALGSPLVGDPLYGGVPGDFYLEHVLLRLPTRAGELVCYQEPRPEPVAAALTRRLRSLAGRSSPTEGDDPPG